jgi:hypothetical protein
MVYIGIVINLWRFERMKGINKETYGKKTCEKEGEREREKNKIEEKRLILRNYGKEWRIRTKK